jgi:hypothetical protein
MALALPLAACGSMHGSSGDSAATAQSAAPAAAASATVTGTVDRSGVASTTDTTDPGMSAVGAAVTTLMAGGTTPSSASTAAATTAAVATSTAATAGASKSASPVAQPAPVTSSPPAAPAPVPVATNNPVPANKKSISGWVSCGTAADDTTGAQAAFAAARQNAFTLVVDCPVHLKSGLAIDRGIFIDNGTAVEFTGAGKFYVDNLFHPAFVIANSSNITLTNWNVEWDGSVPVNPDVGGYIYQGSFVSKSGQTQPANAFNDVVLTEWLKSNRKVTFDETQGWVTSIWVGAVNPAAVFFITGDTSNVVFSGLTLSVPATAGGDHFLPMAVSFSANWNSNQTVNARTPRTTAYATVPHGITFSGVSFDGTLMGFQGNVRDAVFQNLTSHRYADLMDANGGTTGGIAKWFPPPHLFYLNYTYDGDPGLFNSNIQISNVQDVGPRLGVARDKGGADSSSGYVLSLKLGCVDCSVDGYTSNRPDGFMDLLPSQNLSVMNVTATFDSSFINNIYPAGIRFPSTGYSHITYGNVSLQDTAESTIKAVLGNATSSTNDTMVFSNFQITLNRWAGSDLPVPSIGGPANSVAVDLLMTNQSTRVSYLQKGAIISTLEGSPVTLRPGASTVLTWTSKDAQACMAGGAWSGSVGTGGTRVVTIGASGNADFSLNCQNSVVLASTAVVVSAQ